MGEKFEMRVSVIIPTFERANKILNIIKALEKQTFTDFETLVIIDGSQDNTKNIIDNYVHSLKKLTVIYQANQGRAKVRNSGVKLTNGDLLIFFDDDMRPLPNCVEEHVFFHQEFRSCIVVGGLNEDMALARTDIQKYKVFLGDKWVRELRAWKKPLNENNLYLTGANLSISRDMFDMLRGFDEQLNDLEDWDLAVRAFNVEIPIYYHHEAFAWHDDFITFATFLNRQKQYKLAYKSLISLKSDIHKSFFLKHFFLPTRFKIFIYKFLHFNFLVWCVDYFNFFRFFPMRIRFKIYDLIIAAHLSISE